MFKENCNRKKIFFFMNEAIFGETLSFFIDFREHVL
jgi:hypothetical protein